LLAAVLGWLKDLVKQGRGWEKSGERWWVEEESGGGREGRSGEGLLIGPAGQQKVRAQRSAL
jgi:hypothetical protein